MKTLATATICAVVMMIFKSTIDLTYIYTTTGTFTLLKRTVACVFDNAIEHRSNKCAYLLE